MLSYMLHCMWAFLDEATHFYCVMKVTEMIICHSAVLFTFSGNIFSL